MLDIRILVFNMGRVDYRRCHLAAYALECQASLHMVHGDAAYQYSQKMLAAVGALVEMQGIVRMMNGLCSGLVFEQRGKTGVIKQLDGGPWKQKNMATTWWTTCRTLLSHRCWRFFPYLSVKLPEILLGGSLNGVMLKNDIFMEPGDPAVGGVTGLNKWQRGALQRQERFKHVMHALERLMHWARAERRSFMSKTMGVTPPTSKRVQQALDKDLPNVDNADVNGVHAMDDSDKEFEEKYDEIEVRCSFVRPAVKRSNNVASSAVGDATHLVDLLSDNILPSSSVDDAALELDAECNKLPKPLAADDIASLLTGFLDQPQACDAFNSEDNDTDTCSEDSNPDRTTDPVVDGLADSTADPVVDGLVDANTMQTLAHAFMRRTPGPLMNSVQRTQERRAFLALPHTTWIIALGKKRGVVLCVPQDVYEPMWRRRLVRSMADREQFIMQVGNLFCRDLFSDSSLQDLRQPLASLHKECDKYLWGLQKESMSYDICSVVKHPPQEVFVDCSVDALSQQYGRMRSWLQSLKTMPYGHEFHKPISFLVRVIDLSNEPSGVPFTISAEAVDTSSWPHRFVPKLPALASTQKYGSVLILAAQTEPDLLKFYQYTMATNVTEIRCMGIWNIVVGWHFYVQNALSSESLAEAVGSNLEVTRRHNINGGLSMKSLVWSSQLRAIGLKGFGGEEGVMAYALNIHFGCKGPEGWHVVAKRVKANKSIAARLQRELRLLSKPKWFNTYLFDLINTGEITLCKPVPRPEMAVLARSTIHASRWQQLTNTAKRQKISEEAEDQYNPQELNDNLWKQLKITRLSLPSCLRPGKHSR